MDPVICLSCLKAHFDSENCICHCILNFPLASGRPILFCISPGKMTYMKKQFPTLHICEYKQPVYWWDICYQPGIQTWTSQLDTTQK